MVEGQNRKIESARRKRKGWCFGLYQMFLPSGSAITGRGLDSREHMAPE